MPPRLENRSVRLSAQPGGLCSAPKDPAAWLWRPDTPRHDLCRLWRPVPSTHDALRSELGGCRRRARARISWRKGEGTGSKLTQDACDRLHLSLSAGRYPPCLRREKTHRQRCVLREWSAAVGAVGLSWRRLCLESRVVAPNDAQSRRTRPHMTRTRLPVVERARRCRRRSNDGTGRPALARTPQLGAPWPRSSGSKLVSPELSFGLRTISRW
jgi:hypothetical protein